PSQIAPHHHGFQPDGCRRFIGGTVGVERMLRGCTLFVAVPREAVEGGARSSLRRFLILAAFSLLQTFRSFCFFDFFISTISIFRFFFFRKNFFVASARRVIWRTLPAHSDLRRRQSLTLCVECWPTPIPMIQDV